MIPLWSLKLQMLWCHWPQVICSCRGYHFWVVGRVLASPKFLPTDSDLCSSRIRSTDRNRKYPSSFAAILKPRFRTTWLRFSSRPLFRTRARNPVGPRPGDWHVCLQNKSSHQVPESGDTFQQLAFLRAIYHYMTNTTKQQPTYQLFQYIMRQKNQLVNPPT